MGDTMAEGAARSILHQLYTQKPKTVCIVGSGNWGSTAAKIIGENILTSEAGFIFAEEVRMWVFDEDIPQSDGSVRKLSEIINTDHENVKYLPGIALPPNVKAITDVKKAIEGAHVLV